MVSSVVAQTNSPYSRYGYGVLRDQAVGPSKGMGGIGYGLRHKQGANPMNPASYSNVDSLTFLFDVGVSYTNSKLSEGSASQNDDNGGLDYITMLFPVSRRLGVSVGVLPYSTIGYSYGSVKEVSGVTHQESFDGSGGLSQIYGGIGYETPLKGLSVGANVSYLFGKMKYNRGLTLGSSAYNSMENTQFKIRTVKFDIGLQYQMDLSPKDVLVIGAFYSPKINSKGDYESVRYDYYGSSSTPSSWEGDTIPNLDANLPATYGIGFSYARNRNLLVGADITYQKWENLKYPSKLGDGLDSPQRFNDRWKYAAGIEYSVDPYDRNYFKKIKIRGGFNYSNSYLNVVHNDGLGNTSVKGYDEYGATFGLGLPLKDSEMYTGRTSYINITFEYKRISPEVKTMIKEEYFGVSLGVNINDLWFVKRKIF